MRVSAHDKAIAAIMKWAQREEWRDRLDAIIADHLEPAFGEFDLEPDELPDLLGQGGYTQLIGCAFEDFATCDFEPDGQNVIDDYLKRRGWKEPAPVRHYLEALRRSVMSLYEVVGTTPGRHFMARDLIRGGEPIQVRDKLASQSLAQWDRIAARMLPVGNEVHMAGGVVPLTFEDSDALLDEFTQARKSFARSVKRQARQQGVPIADIDHYPMADAILGEMAPLFTQAWLTRSLRSVLGQSMPNLVNFDGDKLIFSETRFPIQDPARSGEIEHRLDDLADLVRDEAEQPSWTWLTDAPPAGAVPGASTGAVMFKTYDEQGGRVLGSVRLDPAAVVLRTNSVERAERGKSWLAGVLGPLVKAPLTALQTPEQAMAEHAVLGDDRPPPEPPLPPEEMAALLHEVEDRHYREILSQPIPMLDGKSPKQAVRSKAGRRKVVEWLKYLENGAARRSRAQGHPAYDFSWMWEALKITDLRH
ncbi:hypothetical protein GGE65_007526 [Skermanella aerolata]|uniref:hypothetical protein n=1 Tax=Skermanella aerolata TaxID=393310 RepID=UPI003D255768